MRRDKGYREESWRQGEQRHSSREEVRMKGWELKGRKRKEERNKRLSEEAAMKGWESDERERE